MSAMPNRQNEVISLCNSYPEVFNVPPEQNDDSRRKFLLGIILPNLIALDRNWGYLVKPEKGNFIPCDIVVWKDTLEHVDVMTGTGGSWQPHGPITSVNPNWKWSQDGLSTVPTPSTPPDTPLSDKDLAEIKVNQAAIMGAITQLHQEVSFLSDKFDDLRTEAGIASDGQLKIITLLNTLLARPAPIYDTKIFGATVVAKPRL